MGGIYVPGYGNSSAKLMIVLEAPGKTEEEIGKPAVGATGRLLDEFLFNAGITRDQVYVTNVVKVRPPDNKLKRLSEIGRTIDEFVPQLWEEIKAIKPNAILALGNLSLSTLTGKTGILNYRGSILPTIDGMFKVIASIHPAGLLHIKGIEGEDGKSGGVYNANARFYMQLDINRAVEESAFPELRLPNRLLEVCTSSSQLYRFLYAYRDKRIWASDIETYHSIPTCTGLSPSPSHAMSIPLLNLSGIGAYEIPKSEQIAIWKQLIEFYSRRDLQLIGQNWKFDEDKIESVLGIDVPNLYADTMFAMSAAYAEFPKSLQFQASVLTREPFYKDEGREFDPRKDDVKRLYLYNAKDCAVTIECWERLHDILKQIEKNINWPNWVEEFFFNYVMKLHDLYMEIESRGLLVDSKQRDILWEKYDKLDNDATNELSQIYGAEVNANSPKQISNFLFSYLKLPYRNSVNEDTLVALLANNTKNETQKRAIELILDVRRYRKTKSTYILAEPDYDGRMRTAYRITGTETGRTSTSKLEPPLRPTKKIGLAFQTMTKHGDIGAEIRSMFIPDPGKVFGEADKSQAEARVVALLSRDPETLNLFNTIDIHRLTASWAFGVEYDKVSKEQRFVGKTLRHAGNYGMGKRRLMTEIMSSAKRFHINIFVSEWKAGKILDIFHDRAPKIRGVFHREVEEFVREHNYLVNPYGRYRMFYDKMGKDLLQESYAQIPQSTVSDSLKKDMLEVKRRLPWLEILLESHDAFLWQCEPGNQFSEVAGVVKEVMERPIDFSRCSLPRGELIIPCDIQIGDNYKDMEKVKV